MLNMIIRNADPTDFSSILTMTELIYEGLTNKALFNWPGAVLSTELRQVKTLVLEENKSVLSFVCYRDLIDVFEISILATHPQQQNKCLQTKLLQYFQSIAAKQRKSILLEVHQQNEKAKALYQKLGFKILNERKKYYSDGADALVMMWDSDKAGC